MIEKALIIPKYEHRDGLAPLPKPNRDVCKNPFKKKKKKKKKGRRGKSRGKKRSKSRR